MTTRYTEARNAIDAPGAVGSPVERPVRPRAWAIFVDNGNARMWSTLQPHVQKLADAEGLTVTPLYDQAALDALLALLKRCRPIIEADAQMMADISRHAPLDADSQAKHDATEYESEKLARELERLLGPNRT